MTSEQVFPGIAATNRRNRSFRHAESLGERSISFAALPYVKHLLFRKLGLGVFHTLGSCVGAMPNGILDVFSLRSPLEVQGVNALGVSAEVANDRGFFPSRETRDQKRRRVHTHTNTIVRNGGVSRLAVVKFLVDAFRRLEFVASGHGFNEPLQSFTIKRFTEQRITVGKVPGVVSSTVSSLVKWPIAARDAAGLFCPLLSVMGRAKVFSLVWFTASGNFTDSFHAGGTPLSTLKGV